MPTGDILRRKLRPRATAQPRPTAAATVERSMQLALARAAQRDCALPVIVTEVAVRTLSLPELLEMIEPGTLLAVLEGPGDGLGLVALDASALAAILEQQTTGTVAAEAPPPRRPTRIDAAMCAPLIDLLLEEFDSGLRDCVRNGQTDLPPQGFRYASFIEDPRPLGLVLEDGRYRTFPVTVALGSVARPGRVLLALPAGTGTAPQLPANAARGAGACLLPRAKVPGQPEGWQARLHQSLCPAPASLDAVLGRLRLPLGTVTGWQPGDVIPLPGAHLDAVVLGGGPAGGLLRGRLGQCRGQRAIRLALPAPDSAAAMPPAPPDDTPPTAP